MISQMGKKDDLILYIFESFIFNIVKGIREDGETISKYFIQLQKLEDLHKFLTELREDINQPFFPLPKYGISTRLEKQGMSLNKACQAAAIFKIELEACLLEAWLYINPRMSAKIFWRNHHSIWNLSKPFWMNKLLNNLKS